MSALSHLEVILTDFMVNLSSIYEVKYLGLSGLVNKKFCHQSAQCGASLFKLSVITVVGKTPDEGVADQYFNRAHNFVQS